jgi:hypothetical protein
VDDAFTLDVAVQKWLWGRRLRAHFGVRNLLGGDLRYHPAGATFGPTVTVELEGTFPGSDDRSKRYVDLNAAE